jgi:acyl-coenzyme A synthetase/AMP-(fatty) acid ligase/thioesterase domain-containing protein/acyl carrier protein
MNLAPLSLNALERSDIPSRLGHIASVMGEKIAIRSNDETMTFHQLDERASLVAQSLAGHFTTGRQYPVVLLLESGMSVFPAIYGILRAGHFYCAVPAHYPLEYIARLLKEMGESVLLTEQYLLDRVRDVIPEACRPMIYSRMETSLQEFHRPSMDPNALAAIYYTSGSTGVPKGVMLSLRDILYIVHNYGTHLGIRPGDRALAARPFGSYSSAVDVFGGLMNGACLVPYDFRVGGVSGLVSVLKSEGITVFRPPVQLARSILEVLPEDEFFPYLRLFFATGDVFYKKDVERLRPFLRRDAVIVHQLASSETGLLTVNKILFNTPLEEEVIPLGKPLPGQEVLILDDKGGIITDGRLGEIGVRGDYIFSGYWRHPEWMPARFVPDPRDPQKRIFRTGDLGRFRPDGQLVFAGRNDSRVRVKGYSVDLNEVDHAIQTIKGVERSVTVVQVNQSGVKRLVAYVQPIGDSILSPSDLRKSLLRIVPDYMAPYLFVSIDEFPLTYAGKVDRKALPLPDWKQSQSSAEYVSPRDDIEKHMTLLWQKVFGIERIGIHDNFFDLGGDSLLASALFVEIELTYKKRFPLSLLLKHGTVESLAAIVRTQSASNLERLVVLRAEGKNPPLFLVPGGGSDTITFIELVDALGEDQPVYGLEDLFMGTSRSHYALGIQHAAREFIKTIKRVQPGGPYYLGGHSFGGLVAFEIARQLRASGEQVGMLAILDTYPPVKAKKMGKLSNRVQTHWANIENRPPKEVLGYFARQFKRRLSKLGQTRWLQRLYKIKWIEDVLWFDHRRYVESARSEYAPGIYEGDAVVYRATERPRSVTWDKTAAWTDYITGKVEFFDVPGLHTHIVKHPHAEHLARLMAEHLSRAYALRQQV